jgi:hypothetical protein
MARRRYKRKSHLAEAINRSSPAQQRFWSVVVMLAFVFSMVMYFSH